MHLLACVLAQGIKVDAQPKGEGIAEGLPIDDRHRMAVAAAADSPTLGTRTTGRRCKRARPSSSRQQKTVGSRRQSNVDVPA